MSSLNMVPSKLFGIHLEILVMMVLLKMLVRPLKRILTCKKCDISYTHLFKPVLDIIGFTNRLVELKRKYKKQLLLQCLTTVITK